MGSVIGAALALSTLMVAPAAASSGDSVNLALAQRVCAGYHLRKQVPMTEDGSHAIWSDLLVFTRGHNACVLNIATRRDQNSRRWRTLEVYRGHADHPYKQDQGNYRNYAGPLWVVSSQPVTLRFLASTYTRTVRIGAGTMRLIASTPGLVRVRT